MSWDLRMSVKKLWIVNFSSEGLFKSNLFGTFGLFNQKLEQQLVVFPLLKSTRTSVVKPIKKVLKTS